jgi:hypothetical protein
MKPQTGLPLAHVVVLLIAAAGVLPASSSISDGRKSCRVLENIGLPTRPWNQLDGDYGQCISEMTPFGPAAALRSNLNYQAAGKNITSVDAVSIMANVNVPSSKPEARKRVFAAVQQWFRAIGKTAPKGIEQAIQTDKPFKAKVDDLTVRYEPALNGRVFEMIFRAKDKEF